MKNENTCLKKIYIRIFTAALLIIVLEWRQTKFPLREMEKCDVIIKMQSYSAI